MTPQQRIDDWQRETTWLNKLAKRTQYVLRFSIMWMKTISLNFTPSAVDYYVLAFYFYLLSLCFFCSRAYRKFHLLLQFLFVSINNLRLAFWISCAFQFKILEVVFLSSFLMLIWHQCIHIKCSKNQINQSKSNVKSTTSSYIDVRYALTHEKNKTIIQINSNDEKHAEKRLCSIFFCYCLNSYNR